MVGAVLLDSPEHLKTRLVAGGQNTSQNEPVTDQQRHGHISGQTLVETSVSGSESSYDGMITDDGESTDGTVPPLVYYDSSSDESNDELSEDGDFEDHRVWAANNVPDECEGPFERLFVNAEEMGQELSVPEIAELL